MRSQDMDISESIKIGIVGCGHLGQAILESLIKHGFLKDNIFISYKGNAATYERLEKSGFAACILDNDRIFNAADIVFLTVKPQDIRSLRKICFSKNTVVVSCLAGLSTEILKNMFNIQIHRMMLSGPDTIIAGKGIATMYPYNELAGCILAKMSLRLFEITQEKDIDIFTTGVCLPAALLLEDSEFRVQEAINEIAQHYAAFWDVYQWAKGVLPLFHAESEKTEYISRMITKGGVTEAIVDSLKAGEPFITALKQGIIRSQDISREISNSFDR